MKKINSLSDLLMEEMNDLLNAEAQLAEALPQMADASKSTALKATLEDYQKIAREHVNEIQDIFKNIRQNPERRTCRGIEGLIGEIEDVINKAGVFPDSDVYIIGLAQRLEEYEISRYATAREHAFDLGHTMMVDVFTKILNEERAMNFHLNELAQGMINAQALDPKRGGFYIREGKFGRKGIKKKSKGGDVSRFISEGNPNVQDPQGKKGEKKGQDSQNLEDEGDLS